MVWGVAFDFSVELGNTFLVCATRLSNDEFIACSANGTYVFGKGRIRAFLSSVYSAIYYCEELELVFGVTAGIPQLEVFSPMAPKVVLVSIALNQALVQQIHVSRAANAIITVGSDIKVWSCDFKLKPANFRLELKGQMPGSRFCQGMNDVFFDEKRDRVLVPTHTGYCLYGFDGELLAKNPNLSMYTFRSVSVEMVSRKMSGVERIHSQALNVYKQFLASDGSGTIRVWNECGDVIRSFPPGKRAVVFVGYVTSEFAIAIDSGGGAKAMDVKTGKVALLQNLPSRIDRIYLFRRPKAQLLVLSGCYCHVYNIDFFWSLFYNPVYKVQQLQRFSCESYAARIGMTLDDGSVLFISARKKYPVGCAASRTGNLPIAFACERDCSDTEVVMVMKDMSVQLFSYTSLEFEVTKVISKNCLNAVIVKGTHKLKWLVAMAGVHGEIIFLKYGTWKLVKQVYHGQYHITRMFWWREKNCLVAFDQEKLIVLDLLSLSLILDTQFDNPLLIQFENGNFLASYPKGKVVRYRLEEMTKLVQVDRAQLESEVNAISMMFGAHVIVFDKKCLVGNEQVFSYRTFEFPFHLTSACFLNHNLDILIGLDSEVMIVSKDKYYPGLAPLYVPQRESEEEVKVDPLAKDPVRVTSRKFVQEIEDESEDEDGRPTIDEIVLKIRQKLKEERKRIFRWKPKREPAPTRPTNQKKTKAPAPPPPVNVALTPRRRAQIITNESKRSTNIQRVIQVEDDSWSDVCSSTFPTSQSAPKLNQRTGEVSRKSIQDCQSQNNNKDTTKEDAKTEEVVGIRAQQNELAIAIFSKSDVQKVKPKPNKESNNVRTEEIERLLEEQRRLKQASYLTTEVPSTTHCEESQSEPMSTPTKIETVIHEPPPRMSSSRSRRKKTKKRKITSKQSVADTTPQQLITPPPQPVIQEKPPQKNPKLKVINIPVPPKPIPQQKPDPFDQPSSDSDKEPVQEKPVYSRPILITQESLQLFNPMNVPRIRISFEGQPRPASKPPLKPKRVNHSRKLAIRRKQILSEV